MKVSIVIPAHNEEAVIESSIQSALNQDYPDFEIIVVDNNCTDKTVELAKKMGVTVAHESRKGTLWARERGRIAGVGEIIANLDADCLPEPDWVQKGVKHFSSPNTLFVTGPYDYYDGSKFFRRASLFIQKNIYPLFNFALQKMNKGAVIIEGNVFYRKEALERIGGFNTDITFYGDGIDTAKRILKIKKKEEKLIFDTSLIVKTSARRFKKEGTLRTFGRYLYHFFKNSLGSFR